MDEFAIGPYDECVDWMFQYGRDHGCHSPIYAADMLRGWAMFETEEPSQKKSGEKELKKLLQNVERKCSGQEVRILPKVGRNDPCPCGSGKKV